MTETAGRSRSWPVISAPFTCLFRSRCSNLPLVRTALALDAHPLFRPMGRPLSRIPAAWKGPWPHGSPTAPIRAARALATLELSNVEILVGDPRTIDQLVNGELDLVVVGGDHSRDGAAGDGAPSTCEETVGRPAAEVIAYGDLYLVRTVDRLALAGRLEQDDRLPSSAVL